MCLEKPSFTERPIRPVRERIELLKQDASITSREAIKEIIHTEVRGGRGSSYLAGWTQGSINDKDPYRKKIEGLYDYKRGSKIPKEWLNIEVGKDIYKFSRNEVHDMKNAGILSLIVLGSFLIAFFI